MSVALHRNVQVPYRGPKFTSAGLVTWSPEEIAGSLKREHSNLPVMPPSLQSILPDVDIVERGDQPADREPPQSRERPPLGAGDLGRFLISIAVLSAPGGRRH